MHDGADDETSPRVTIAHPMMHHPSPGVTIMEQMTFTHRVTIRVTITRVMDFALAAVQHQSWSGNRDQQEAAALMYQSDAQTPPTGRLGRQRYHKSEPCPTVIARTISRAAR